MAINQPIIVGAEIYMEGTMSIAIEQTIHALQIVLQMVPVGTNLALLHLLWSMLNGSFLASRGAIFPALALPKKKFDEVGQHCDTVSGTLMS